MHWNAKRPEERLDSKIMVGVQRRLRDQLEEECERRKVPLSWFIRDAIRDKLDKDCQRRMKMSHLWRTKMSHARRG